MINYFLNYSGRKVYIEIIKSLDEANLAKPSLLYGDPRLDDELIDLYPNKVLREKFFLQDFYKINNFQYKDSSIYNFFSSRDYLIYKDQIFKMMDRLDPLGGWNRIDRESFLNKLIIFWFSKIKQLKPDIIIFCDTPHTYESYSLYVVAKYLEKPIYLINQWGIAPCVYGEIVYKKNSKFLPRVKKWTSDKIIKKNLKKYLNTLSFHFSRKDYRPYYIKTKYLENSFIGKLIYFYMLRVKRYKDGDLSMKRILYRTPIFIFSKLIEIIFNFFHIIFDFLFLKFFKLDFNNPFNFSIIMKKKINKDQRKALQSSYLKSINIFTTDDLKSNKDKYVFFAMHFEPEASTLPMGENFYDQYMAILALRKWLPKNIKLFVKEHPSQMLTVYGPLGRSRYFYDSLNKISGIYFVSGSLNSIEVTKHSLFVASITGVICLEASYLGKKGIYFGKPWYRGLPNTFKWKQTLNFSKVLRSKIINKKKVQEFLFDHYTKYAYPAMLNPSTPNLFPIANDKTYKSYDYFAMRDLMCKILDDSKKYLKNENK